ncbi:GNAT family N-acetyltransferase [Bacillus sp. 165]|uniref:GNAT family N-acetyltransferase n=1 Tax=Bacillus sp. 165 TaxID=1529117 RepID=UPI001ADB59FA|nr:GNAT family N-acetyltransferase [Bacillus sp. 165]MBO9130745.1 GNAT family N-acetyltransferase [Bacillus sp. 165]
MLVDKIIECEKNFPEIQSKVIEKPYGKIFYDKNNPLSYDSNHAVINEGADFAFAVEDVINFYKALDLTPRVYTFTKNKNAVGQYLKSKGFNQSIEEICFFVQKNKHLIDTAKTIDVKRINCMDEEIYELYSSDEEQGEWGYKALMQCMGKENFYLFGGYKGRNLVCTASLYKQHDISRINDVFTKKDERGKGYGSQLINFITDFNHKTLKTISYLYATNPNAISVYKKAGYEEMDAITRGYYWIE